MTLFGHSQDLPRAMALIKRMRPAFWKAIDPDPASAAECAQLGVKLIVRHNGPWDQDASGFRAVGFYNECAHQPWLPFCWAIETPNEPFPGRDVPAEYVDQEALLVTLLWTAGKECVVSNRGTAHDGHFVPGAKWYGGHEYGFPELLSQAPEHALRYRRWFPAILDRAPDARLFITECGVTQAVVGGPDVGWHSDGRSTEAYWQGSLLPYAEELARDAYVLGAAVFQAGGNEDWRSFEVLDTEIEGWMAAQQVGDTGATTDDFARWGGIPAQEEPMPENMTLGPGMQAKAADLGAAVTGKQLTGERYMKNPDGSDVFSFAVFERGELRYYPGTGLTAFIPFA